MNDKLKNLVSFNIDRLFCGAIDVDWLATDKKKAEQAASAFVFHGPSYHGVSQRDIGSSGHKLIDTASFALKTVENLSSGKGNPFVLAIAGFGSGKSHLAVTLSELLATPNAELKKSIIANISQVDANIARNIQREISELDTGVLILTLNGMNNSDLSSALLAQLKEKIAATGLNTAPLENLRKRFKHASNLLKGMDVSLLGDLFAATGTSSKDELILRLGEFDENTYKPTHEFLQSIGIPLNVIGDETAKDVLNLVAEEYIGEDKPFQKLLILFDEFGHYMEFATSKPQLAGNGALQHLFEGIQNNDGKIKFIGFVQYELKAYEQRLPSEFKNEIRRFITRFDNADKLYLSSNLETLVASLLEKSTMPTFDSVAVEGVRKKIGNWYPVSQTFATWADPAMFAKVIAEGCWPLSPLAMWVLFSLSAIGKYLQQRSALTLLKASLIENEGFQISSASSTLPPVALWTTELQQELESIEEEQIRGSVIQAYNAVLEKIGQHISDAELKVLRAIVLFAQTHLRANDKNDALLALGYFTGLSTSLLQETLIGLEDEKNVLAWDDAVKQYEILSDSVSRPQFLRTLRTKAIQEYDSDRQSKLFIKGASVVSSLITPVECDFSSENSISTPEWRYEPRVTYWELFKKTVIQLTAELKSISEFMPIDAARGLVIYCYVTDSESPTAIKDEAQRILKAQALNLPIILVLLFDNDVASIAKPLIDLDIIENFSAQEKEQYSRLIGNHQKKQRELLENAVRKALLERNYLTPYPQTIEVGRLKMMGDALFEKLFAKVIPFPFDGYATGRGNAAKDCMEFTRKLLISEFRFDDTQTMPPQQRNRAQTVLGGAWKVFAKDGSVALKQSPFSVRSVVMEWDNSLNNVDNSGLNCADAIRSACCIPYGANLPLAGLLFAVYFQARQNNVSVLKDGAQISFSSVINNLFSGQILNITELKTLTLYKAESGNSEWDQLLFEWGNCESYKELCEFLERKENLNARLPIPATLRGSIAQLERQSVEAKRKIEDADQKESDAIEKIENGIQKGKVSVITWGASLLQSCIKHKIGDSMWSQEDDIIPLAEKVIEAKQHIIQGFQTWLVGQRPTGMSIEALSDFKRDLVERVGGSLKNLEMQQEREALLKYVEGISKNFEAISRAQQAIVNVDSWMVANLVVSESTILQLDEKRALVEQQMEILKPCRTSMKRINRDDMVNDLTTRIDKLEEFATTLLASKKVIDKRALAIWNTTLLIDRAESIAEEISELIRLYTGTSADLADFRLMRNLIAEFIDINRRLDVLELPQTDFETLSTTLKESFISRYVPEEPPWDPKEAIEKLVSEITQKRNSASKDWVTRIEERYAKVGDMTIQDGQAALQTLSALPSYFNASKDGKSVERVKKAIEKHLESQGVEWLYEKYTELSTSAKRAFLALVEGKK